MLQEDSKYLLNLKSKEGDVQILIDWIQLSYECSTSRHMNYLSTERYQVVLCKGKSLMQIVLC